MKILSLFCKTFSTPSRLSHPDILCIEGQRIHPLRINKATNLHSPAQQVEISRRFEYIYCTDTDTWGDKIDKLEGSVAESQNSYVRNIF